jgi:hypothetical protein
MRSRSGAGTAWRRCTTHTQIPSQGVCTRCGKGWCLECVKSQGSAMICPGCDALCVPAAYHESIVAKERMRTRPLVDELGTVFGYPLSDKTAFFLLALFVGVFSVAASLAAFGGAGLAILLSQGLLYAYAFTAINRVSSGDFGSFMPNVADPADLAQPLLVGLAALLISAGPLLALGFLHPPAEVLQTMGAPAALVGAPAPSPSPSFPPEIQALREAAAAATAPSAGEAAATEAASLALHEPAPEEPGVPRWVFFAYALAIVWKVVYSPVALVAAAISRSFVATLNPLAGLGAIGRMGGIYWTAMAVYTAIALVETLLVGGLGLIPIAGRFLAAFVQSYTYLAIGCLLGFAVFKKAPELGLD